MPTIIGSPSSEGATSPNPPTSSPSEPQLLSLLAGNTGGYGYTDGTGAAAKFSYFFGIARDSSGNLYVADDDNSVIRKITSSGEVSTFAGQPGIFGSADGQGNAALFNGPRAITIDSSGNLYVVDGDHVTVDSNHNLVYPGSTIRKISPSGFVHTLAGSPGVVGAADGQGAAASFYLPCGIAVDSSGTLYVADTRNNTIRQITSFGNVSTIAGTAGTTGSTDGAASGATFNNPWGVTVDGSGNLYVADHGNATVRKISSGQVSTIAGTAGMQGSADGQGTSATFDFPTGIASDGAGTFYITDSGTNMIRVISSSGMVSTLAGQTGLSGYADGQGSAAKFSDPDGVVLDGSGNLYVVDSSNTCIRKVTSSGNVTTLAGSAKVSGSSDGQGSTAAFNGPQRITADRSGNLYVTDENNNTIRKITPSGYVSTIAGAAGSGGSANGYGSSATFNDPVGIVVGSSGNLFITDNGNNLIREASLDGSVTTLTGNGVYGDADGGAGTQAFFNGPTGIAMDSNGNTFVVDSFSGVVRKISSAGQVTTIAGTPNVTGYADGTGAAARFEFPHGIVVDSNGNLFVADTYNFAIRKITPSGVVTTFAGTAQIPGTSNGTGTSASFGGMYGLAIDPSDNLYVTDMMNGLVRKVTPSAVVSTYPASFNNPYAIGVDSAGNIYVQTHDCLIQKGTPGGTVTTLAGSSGNCTSADGAGAGAGFGTPQGTSLAIDASGNVYVPDQNAVRKVTPAGVVTTIAGSLTNSGFQNGPGASALLSGTSGVTSDSSGNLYVTDTNNGDIREITADDVVSQFAGGHHSGTSDGMALTAGFAAPYGIAADSAGNLYVSDVGSNTIRKITATGYTTTFAGSGSSGSADGLGTSASFGTPADLTVDLAGNVFVVDSGNYTIRKITPEGMVSTLAGTAGVSGSQDGPGSTATFIDPTAIAIDLSTGTLFVGDGNVVRKITPEGFVTTVVGTPNQPGTVLGTLPGGLRSVDGLVYVNGLLYILSDNAVLVASGL
ncbi:MAG: SMP-30/gluconolactonase/LRE family protein [Oligoflexia bacterium]|nr:SMP-30/gluconolactonase/LRE family protein [Oligoflexia bacterium]